MKPNYIPVFENIRRKIDNNINQYESILRNNHNIAQKEQELQKIRNNLSLLQKRADKFLK